MARDQKRHASDKEVADVPPVAAPVSSGSSHGKTQTQQDQMRALVRALARDAARIDHEQEEGNSPRPYHKHKA